MSICLTVINNRCFIVERPYKPCFVKAHVDHTVEINGETTSKAPQCYYADQGPITQPFSGINPEFPNASTPHLDSLFEFGGPQTVPHPDLDHPYPQ